DQAAVADVLELEISEVPFRLESATACDRLLRQCCAQLFDELFGRLNGQQIRLREVPVVDGIRFRPTRRCGAGVLVPVTSLLGDRPTVGANLRLALDLVANGTLHRTHRVDVLGLSTSSQRCRLLAFGYARTQ